MSWQSWIWVLTAWGGLGWLDSSHMSMRPEAASTTGEHVRPTSEQLRLREGSKITEEVGEFRETGGRIAFYPDATGHSIIVLENLALERVSRELDQGKRKWSVTGKVTEFRGSNYLLLERVVLKSRSALDAVAPR